MESAASNGNSIIVSIIYVAVAVGLTVWLAKTLYRSGTALLQDVFADKPERVQVLYGGWYTQGFFRKL